MLLDATLWIICGAGRRVGKTWIADRLCEILPGAVYAKLGHGKRSPEKHRNFFHDADELADFLGSQAADCEHAVVEANDPSLRRDADIIIYIDEIPGQTDAREDAAELRATSDIHIHTEGVEDPDDILGTVVENLEQRTSIAELLEAQTDFLRASRPCVRSKVWFEIGGRRTFGPGLAELLDGVERGGSLAASAEAAGMSYRHAWDLIETAEDRFGRRLIERHPGGPGGGGSELTPAGAAMLKIYRRLNEDVARYTDECYDTLYKQIMEDDLDDTPA